MANDEDPGLPEATAGEESDGLDGQAVADDGTGLRAIVERSRDRLAAEQARVNELIDRYHRRPVVAVGLRMYQRDRESAGTIVGSAVAFRLFLYFVPLTLFAVGLLGFLSRWIEPADVTDAAGLGGTVAAQIRTAVAAPATTRWIATVAGTGYRIDTAGATGREGGERG